MKIANNEISGSRCFIIAELSANHNGSLQTALDTIKAANAGADAIVTDLYGWIMTINCNKKILS